MGNIHDGWELAGLGMGTVFITLAVLALLVFVLRYFTQNRPIPVETEDEEPSVKGEVQSEVLAAIIGAIHHYEGSGGFRIKRITCRNEAWFQAGLRDLVAYFPARDQGSGADEKVQSHSGRKDL